MEQVLAKAALLHQRFQIAVRRHHYPHVFHLHRPVAAADALDFALLQHAQQLGLHGEGHVADLVQKKRAQDAPAQTCRCAAPAAPVNDPFSCPNSSDSISSPGTAAQFSVTNGRARRGLPS